MKRTNIFALATLTLLSMSIAFASFDLVALQSPIQTSHRNPLREKSIDFHNWNDKDGNKVDDLIDGAALGPFDIFVDYAVHPNSSHIDALNQTIGTGSISSVYRYIDTIAVRSVPEAFIPSISNLSDVTMVWKQPEVKSFLDTSVRAIKARYSLTYSDEYVWSGPGDADDSITKGEGITIAILDSGVDDEHEALSGKFLAGFDATKFEDLDGDGDDDVYVLPGGPEHEPGDGSTNPDDLSSTYHGTHCASTALGNPSDGVYMGVAPEAKLVDIRVLTAFGTGTMDDVIEGIEWAQDHKDTDWNVTGYEGIDVLSVSLGSSNASDGSDPCSRAVNNAVEAGIVVVVAAGNDGPDNVGLGAPAAADLAITVAAVDDNGTIDRSDDTVADFSSRGPRDDDGDTDPYDELKPEVAAYGVGIMAARGSLLPGGATDLYHELSGTSMATPHVAGTAALILSHYESIGTSLTPGKVDEILRYTAEDRDGAYDPILSSKYDVAYGWGIVDAFWAVYHHDIAVTDVIPDRTCVYSGDLVQITVTVENQGGFPGTDKAAVPETFDLSIYYDSTHIETRPEISPLPGSQATYQFTWDTTGDPPGEHTISARASTVPLEIQIGDNSLSDGIITIKPRVPQGGLPKVAEIYYKAYPWPNPDVIVQEFLDCVTDWIEYPRRGDLYSAVYDAGHTVSPFNNMSGFMFFPINCRDYKETNGNPNAPLNDSSFRLALSYIYGMDDKDYDVYGYYGVPWFSALGNPVPPAQQPWYDEATVMPNTDNATAWNILSGAGYSIADYGGQQWLYRNGVPVRPPDGPNGGIIDFWYATGEIVYPNGPGGGLVMNWNAFIQDYLGAEGPLMQITPMAYTNLLVDLFAVRDYDIIGTELADLGRYVDWIYDCCHSDNDVPWGWNFCGIHDDDYDRWSEIMLTSMDAAQIQEACENWTRKFVNERMDWFPVIGGMGYCTTKAMAGVGLTNVISMELYGPRNEWSWMCMHWNGTPGVAWPGGSYTSALRNVPDTLNPWTEHSPFGWDIMDRAIIGLLGTNPDTLRNMPYVATAWSVANWTSIPELGIEEGATATFWLRQDVTWHDGYPVTAYDCVENLRFMRQEHPGIYSSTWAHLVYEEADGPYKINVYFDQTGLYYADYVSETALLVPKHIIEVVEDYWQLWAPCDNTTKYAGLGLGPPPSQNPLLTQLIGCGPFVFDYYNRNLDVGHMTKYCRFFIDAPVIGSVVGEWRINPGADYSYKTLIHNIVAKSNDEHGTIIPVTVDVAIYEDDVLAHIVNDTTLQPWEHKYLPGSSYVWTAPGCGLHTIKVVVTGDLFRHEYEHTFAVTIREDINTYCGDLIDFKVDMRDVSRACRAFGSSPGHSRWDPCCDVNDDFKVDMRDIGGTARRFGWTCP